MIKKILVSQPKPASEKSPYFEIEAKQDVQFTFHPFIKIEGLSSREFRQQKIKILDYTAIVFNSRHAIDYFFTLCKELRVQLPEEMKYFGISETVALYIQKYIPYRKRKVFFGSTGKWADLVTVMAKHKTENYLVPLSDVHSDEVTTMLDAKKLKHKECVMYRTISNDYPANEPFDFDMLVLFTPAGVESLIKNFPDFKQGDMRLACFGPATKKALEEAGFRVDLSAPTPEARSMTAAIEQYLEKQQ
ncbi:MAG: uroporphyrinogen-III synthase [Alloprevotella sp.]|uniref:uroporphyrinogen-III synthase n=1 Tax=Prevotellamassilia timonensis TaxID=1852370 RepID=UPI001E16FC0C|nr:uroporphyrinogen-III synthase [Prevotellamassilia timonensis]MBS7396422.1 uroporphyrinogen-III synthase [Prevotellamassilia sp.]MCI5507285.1 uroporphyrinogen-III synthase [Bacteroidales bacterium]MDY2975804.1 uroporphyrinogen-III synthase [Alloprevotella sp.]MCF2633854.1 uroporphyrinogen-III synthase [Prevotellamassilia timonensis]MCI6068954.1 uroporphyrinogen-III synthase [Bacteroidales bacterium]